ncbi:BhlA/UviB family holin-like peptide (plasmid) [Clostridium perfringens]|uniref:BhlA/UviB family holin-like peptide n=1 Tax=Clostridium perfringens TaxID=1502 RepID=UPI000166A380|nr:BhlA/UviB family holin-like peptide [Clostridium perfringens]EDS79104.1 bacteriocin uviB homolog [Clostridium perfringens C str. JGS1495]EDS80317.1 bacteriocin uviB homolog [Clostridium perfringens C str. JGS1495]MBI6069397.1 bacteriocin [Clostridium perfringens]MBI6097572.1 bacteriocin [Clostridium perfringens]MBO3322891.1 bacteriocin [Clostridium perfringens]
MEKEIITQIATNGAFAALFIWLLYDTRKEARERENKLNNLIDKLADKFNLVEDLKEDIEDIKNHIFKEK